MWGHGRAARILLWCVVVGAGGFLLAASNVGLFGQPGGPLLGLGVVLLIAGALALAAGIIGLLALGVCGLLRNMRANRR